MCVFVRKNWGSKRLVLSLLMLCNHTVANIRDLLFFQLAAILFVTMKSTVRNFMRTEYRVFYDTLQLFYNT